MTMRIGIDLGGTKIEALGMDESGAELRRIRIATPREDYEGTVRAIVGLVHQVEAELGERGSVGVGIPGTVIRQTGLVKNANSTWLNGMPLERDLASSLGRPVRCANDANCFTVSEATDGAAAGFDVVFGVIIGTGCGGGISVKGEVHAGPNGLAGEWGHTQLPWQNATERPALPCYCGRTNCLEKWIAGPGLEGDYERTVGVRKKGSEIVAAAAAGEAEAEAALVRYEDRLARGLAQVLDVLDPDAIVLGGGLSNLGRLYDGRLPLQIAKYTFGGGCETPVLKNRHGDSSGVRGAAWLWPQG
jgi:fructokinase